MEKELNFDKYTINKTYDKDNYDTHFIPEEGKNECLVTQQHRSTTLNSERE